MVIGYDIDAFLKTSYHYLLLNSVSSDRIKDEINKMWEFNPAGAFVAMKRYTGMFEYIFYTRDIWMKATLEKR
jgi:tRNA nucleotidyltransferase/poly(A) polymerase